MSDKRQFTINLRDEDGKDKSLKFEMPSIRDAWQLSAAFKKHLDFDKHEEVKQELITLKDAMVNKEVENEKLFTKTMYNLSVYIDSDPEFTETCLMILQRYFVGMNGEVLPDDFKLKALHQVMEKQYFRKAFGRIKAELFINVGLVFFDSHVHMLPVISQMMKNK